MLCCFISHICFLVVFWCVLFLQQKTSFVFKQKTACEILYGLVGSEMCIRDSTNGFQQDLSAPDMQHKVEQEFDALIKALTACDIGVTVLDPKDPTAPDAVFPNNWFSTDEDGCIVLYPMAAESRRTERDPVS